MRGTKPKLDTNQFPALDSWGSLGSGSLAQPAMEARQRWGAVMLGSLRGFTLSEVKLFRVLVCQWRKSLLLWLCFHLSHWGKLYSSTNVITLGSQSQEKCVRVESGDWCTAVFGVTHLLLSFTKRGLFIKQKLKEGNREFVLAKFLIMKEGIIYSEILRIPQYFFSFCGWAFNI